MGVFRQLGLVLWKNLIFRKRHPVLLAFEILWPIVIFLIVVLVRRASPPENKQECHYTPRSMPSAGLPFLQSFVCNIQNECHPDEESAALPNSDDLSSFLTAAQPLLQHSAETEAVLKDLPRTMDLLDAITETLQKPEVQELLNEDLTIKKFLRDPEAVTSYMVDNGYLSRPVAEAVIGASLNISKVLDLTGVIDFKSIVCNPEELSLYLTFPDYVNIATISDALCDIPAEKVSEITDTMLQQFDVSAVMRLMSNFQNATGDYESGAMWEDIAKMIDMVFDMNVLDMVASPEQLLQMSAWFKDMAGVLQKVTEDQSEIAMLGVMLEELDPIITAWTQNSTTWLATKQTFSVIYTVFDWILGQTNNVENLDLTFGSLFLDASGIEEILSSSLDLSTSVVEAVLSSPINIEAVGKAVSNLDRGYDIIYIVCTDPGLVGMFLPGGDTDAINTVQSALCNQNETEVLDQLTSTFDINSLMQVLTNPAKPDLSLMINKLMNASSSLGTMFQGTAFLGDWNMEEMWSQMTQALSSAYYENDDAALMDFTSLMNTVANNLQMSGPVDDYNSIILYNTHVAVELLEATEKALYDIVDYLNAAISVLKSLDTTWSEDPEVMKTILDLIINPAFLYNGTKIGEDGVEGDLTKEVETILQAMNVNNITAQLVKLYEEMDLMEFQDEVSMLMQKFHWSMTDPLPPHNATDYLSTYQRLTTVFERLMAAQININPIFAGDSTWSDDYVKEILLPVFENAGRDLEASEQWTSEAQRTLLTTYYSMKIALKSWQGYADLYSTNTVTGTILNYGVTYGPFFIEAIADTMKDEQMFEALITKLSQDPISLCDESTFRSLVIISEDVPVSDIMDTICNVDMETLNKEWAYEGTGEAINELMYLTNLPDPLPEMPMDWDSIFGDIYDIYDLVSGSVSGQIQMPWDYAQNINYTHMGLAFDKLMTVFYTMNTDDIVGMLGTQSQLTGNFDDMLGDLADVDVVRYYMYSVNEMAKMMTGQMNDIQENGITLGSLMSNSSEFYKMIELTMGSIPDAMKVVEDVVIDPSKMMQNLMTLDLSNSDDLCKGASISDWMTFPEGSDVNQLESMLCNMDLDVLMKAVTEDPVMQKYTMMVERFMTYNISYIPDSYTVNMTETVINVVAMVEAMTQQEMDPDIPIFPDVPGMDIAEIEETMQEMVETIQNMDPNKFIELTQYSAAFAPLLELIADDDITSPLKQYLAITNTAMEIANEYLKGVIETGSLLRTEGRELLKVLEALETSPEYLQLLMSNVLYYMNNPGAANELMTLNLESMCQDKAVFNQVFRDLGNLTLDQAFDGICGVAGINLTTFIEDLIGGLAGQQELMTKLQDLLAGQIPPATQLNLTALVHNAEVFSALVTQLTTELPSMDWFGLEALMDENRYVFDDYLEQLNKLTMNLTTTSVDEMFAQLVPVLEQTLLTDELKPLMLPFLNTAKTVVDLVEEIMVDFLDPMYLKEKTPELHKLVALVNNSQIIINDEFTDSLLADNQKWTDFYMYMVTNISSICMDTSTLKNLIPLPSDSNTTRTIETLVDGVCALNVTALEKDINYITALAEYVSVTLVQAMNNTKDEVDIQALASRLLNMEQTITEQAMTLAEQWDGVLVATTSWGEFWSMMESNLESSFVNMGSNFEDLNTYWSLLSSAQQAGNDLNLFGDIAMFYPSLHTQLIATEILVDKLKLVNVSDFHLADMFPDSPNWATLMGLVEEMPLIVEVIAFSTGKPEFQSLMSMNLTLALQSLCTQPVNTYLDLPEYSSMTMDQLENFHTEFCKIDMGAIVTEAMKEFRFDDVEAAMSNYDPVNFTALVMVNEELNRVITYIAMEAPRHGPNKPLYSSTAWVALAENYANLLMADTESLQGFSAVLDQITPMLESLPREVYTYTRLINSILLEKIGLINTTNPQMADMFPNSPTVQQAVTLLEQMPELVEILLKRSEQLAALSEGNITDAFVTVCKWLYDESLTNPGVTHIRDQWCTLDIETLTQELMMELKVDEFISASQGSVENSTTSANWTVVYVETLMLQSAIQTIINSGPKTAPWQTLYNGTAWTQVILDYAMSTESDPVTSAMTGYESLVQAMSTIFGEEETEKSINFILESVSKAIQGHIDTLSTANLTIEQILAGNPDLLLLVKTSIDLSPDLFASFLQASMNNSEQLIYAFITGDPFEYLCNKTADQLRAEFGLDSRIDAEGVREAICKVDLDTYADDFTKLGYEALNAFGLLDMVTAFMDGNISSTGYNVTHFIYDMTMLESKFQEVADALNSFQTPEYDYQIILNVLEQYFMVMDPVDDLEDFLPMLIASLQPILDIEGMEAIDTIKTALNVYQIVSDYMSDIIEKIQSQPGTIDLYALFKNTTEWAHLVETTLDVAPDLVAILSETSINQEKINELAMFTLEDVNALLCDGDKLQEYFVFSDTVNVTRLVTSLCGLNVSLIEEEFFRVFSIEKLISEVEAAVANSQSLQLEDIVSSYMRFQNHIMALTEGATVYYNKEDLAEVFNVTLAVEAEEVGLWEFLLEGVAMTSDTSYAELANLMEQVFSSLEGTEFYGDMMQIIRIQQGIINILSGKIDSVPDGVITLTDIVKDADVVKKYIQDMFAQAPEITESIMQATIDFNKLVVAFTSPNIVDDLCDTTIFTYPEDSGITENMIQAIHCSTNFTAFLEELKTMIDWDKIEQMIAAEDSSPIDWESYIEDYVKFQTSLDRLFANVTFPELPVFMEINGLNMSDWLQRLEQAFVLPSSVDSDTVNWLSDWLYEQTQDPASAVFWKEVLPYFSAANEVMKGLNKNNLKHTANITLASLMYQANYTTEFVQQVFANTPDIMAALNFISVDLSTLLNNMTLDFPGLINILCSDAIQYPAGIDRENLDFLCYTNFSTLAWDAEHNILNWSAVVHAYERNMTFDEISTFNWTEYLYNLQVFTERGMSLVETNTTIEQFFLYDKTIGEWASELGDKLQYQTGTVENALDVALVSIADTLGRLESEFNSPELTQTLQVFDSMLRVMTHRLKPFTNGTHITLDVLFTDLPKVQEILEVTFGLDVEILDTLLNSSIASEILGLLDGTMINETVCVKPVSEYVTVDKEMEERIARTMSVLCSIDPEVLSMELDEYLSISKTIQELTALWSMNTTSVTFDPEAYSDHLNSFMYLIYDMIQQTPTVDQDVVDLFNLTRIMDLVGHLLTADLTAITESVGGDVSGNLPDSLGAMFGEEVSAVLYAGLDMVNHLLNETLSGNINFGRLLTDPIYSESLVSTLMEYANELIDPNQMPGNTSSSDALQGSVDQLTTVIEQLLTSTNNWTQILGLDLLLGGEDMSFTDSDIDSLISSLTNLLDASLGDEQFWVDIKNNLYSAARVMEFMNDRIDQMKVNNQTYSFEGLFSDPLAAERILASATSGAAALQMMVAEVYPNILLYMTEDNWTTLVCNETLFMETFVFEDYVEREYIQQELCQAAVNNQTFFAELSKLINTDSEEFVDMIEDLTAMTHFANSTYNSMQYYSDQVARFIGNINYLTTAMDVTTDEYIQNWLKFAETVADSSTPSYEQTCTNIVSLLETTPGIPDFATNTLYASVQYWELSIQAMEILPELSHMMCNLPKLQIQELYQEAQDMGLVEWIEKLSISMQTPGNYTGSIDCASFAAVERRYTQLYEQTMVLLPEIVEDTIKCMVDSSNETVAALTQIDSLLKMLQDAMNVLSDFPEVGDDFQKYIPLIMSGILEQEPLYAKLSQLMLNNGTTLEEYLTTVAQLPPSITEAILSATVELDFEQFANATDQEIADIVCDPSKLGEWLSIPTLGVSAEDISAALCNEDLNSTIQAFKDGIDVSKVLLQISESVPEYSLNTDWVTQLSEDLNTFIQDLTNVFDLVSLVQEVDFQEIIALLPRIQELMDEGISEKLADDLEAVLDNFDGLALDETSKTLLEDLKVFVRGLKSLQVWEMFAKIQVTLRDVIKSTDELYEYLTKDLGLSANVSNGILDAEFTTSMIMNITSMDLESEICDANNLGGLISLNNTSVSLEDVSKELCALEDDQIADILDFLTMQLDVGKYVQQFVTLSPETLLASANITQEDLDTMMEMMAPIGESLTLVLSSMGNLSINIPTDAEAIESPSQLEQLSQMVCGVENAFAIEDELGLGAKRKKRAVDPNGQEMPERETWTLDQVREMQDTFDSRFCREMYKDIQRMDNGPIVWRYLKPLLVGKIPYAPASHVTRTIMDKAVFMFNEIEKIQNFTNMMLQNMDNLEDMMDSVDPDDMEMIKDAMENPLVSQVMSGSLGGDFSSLLDQLDMLSSVSEEDMNEMKDLLQMAHDITECVELDRLIPLETEEQLEETARELYETNTLFAATVFPDELTSSMRRRSVDNATIGLPKHIKVKIRMDIEIVQSTLLMKQNVWGPGPEDNFAEKMRYLRGFLPLQDMIETAIIQLQTGDDKLPTIQLQQMPYPCHRSDMFAYYISAYFFPILMIFAWLFLVGAAVRTKVYDREHKLDETMKVMGLKSSISFIGWFLGVFIIAIIMSIVVVLFLKLGNLMTYSNFIVLFLYLLCYSWAITMFCYLMSSFFNRATVAALASLLVYLIMYLPFIVIIILGEYMVFWHKILLYLFAPTAMADAAAKIHILEMKSTGVDWATVFETHDATSFLWCLYMLIIDGAIYFIIGWYISNVFPGKYGTAQPWYFPVSPTYWGCRKKKTGYGKKGKSSKYDDEHGPGEADPEDLPMGVSVCHMTKVYREGKKTAVDDLTVNFYQGQVTAFLGQNGAGKTTTINMLTGMFSPTRGTAYINGRNILREFSDIRNDLGVCPQFDVLFEFMTVHEHLDFYANLKSNLSKKEIKSEISRMLDLTGLRESNNVKVSELSGGQRRRLSVGIAFIGKSKVVVLDEPTSGVDPSARRGIWDLILQHREGCTIILCTHHLDEADILGDRIVMLHKGKLVCSGSPLFLKREYGSGYHLTLAKERRVKGRSADAGYDENALCKTENIERFISSHIPGARLEEEFGTELTFVLPSSEAALAKFPQFFNDLDLNKDDLHIAEYGLRDTSLEEIFLKLTKNAENGYELDGERLRREKILFDKPSDNDSGMGTDTDSGSGDSSMKQSDSRLSHSGTNDSMESLKGHKKHSGLTLKLRQFQGLWLKRFHHHRRDFRSYLSQLVFPVIFIILAMGCSLIKPPNEDQPELMLNPQIYGGQYFMRHSSNTSEIQDIINSMFNDGIGTYCTEGYNTSDLCTTTPSWHQDSPVSGVDYNNPGECHCDTGVQECPPGAGGPPQPFYTTPTGAKIYNITGSKYDTNEYLLKNFADGIRQRYGGWTFDNNDGDAMLTTWFNNKGYHAMTSFYNALHNMVLRSYWNTTDFGISMINHPLSLTSEQLGVRTFVQGVADTGIAIVLLCAFCFVPAGYTIYLINERIHKEKRLQAICGVGTFLYWFTALVWDMMSYCFTVALATLIAYLFGIPNFTARQNLEAFVVILVLFGWATIPLVYVTVRAFNEVSTGYMITFIVNLFIGINTTTCVFLLSLFTYIEVVERAYFYCSRIFLIFPQYCLGNAFILITKNQFITEIYENFGMDRYVTPFSFDLIGWNLVAMGIQGFVFFLLTLIVDGAPWCQTNNSKYGSGRRFTKAGSRADHREDGDVSLERQRVEMGDAKDDQLVLHKLRKEYRRGLKKIVAVEDISVGVQKGECFGLLGVNGAGKTTTFNMLTSDISPTSGKAYFQKRVISNTTSNMKQRVGYCPQFDALDGYTTGEEMLYCYGRLKGIPGSDMKRISKILFKKLGLEQYANKTVRSYSGGTKRKLSTAVALLGEPDVVLLDEPTTGMDPGSKRLVWNNVIKVVKDNRSVVLTSHSMAECEALCTRMAIMVNGKFKCMGSSQHLKNKFSTGYTLTVRVEGLYPNLPTVNNFIQATFLGATVKESHQNVMIFNIPLEGVSLADIFSHLQREQRNLRISEYSLTQTTLDQVFINFARQQTDGTDESNDGIIGAQNKQYDTFEKAKMAQFASNLQQAQPTLTYINPGEKAKPNEYVEAKNVVYEADVVVDLPVSIETNYPEPPSPIDTAEVAYQGDRAPTPPPPTPPVVTVNGGAIYSEPLKQNGHSKQIEEPQNVTPTKSESPNDSASSSPQHVVNIDLKDDQEEGVFGEAVDNPIYIYNDGEKAVVHL